MAQDLLETAHLEHLRGHNQAARALLIRLLSFDPANGAARRLLSIVESAPSDPSKSVTWNWWIALPAGVLALAALAWLAVCVRWGFQQGFDVTVNAKRFIPAISFEAPIWVFASLALGAALGCLAIAMKACDVDNHR